MTATNGRTATFVHATVVTGDGAVPVVTMSATTDSMRVEVSLPLPVAMDLLVAAESAIGTQAALEARARHARANTPFPGLASA